VCWNGNLIGRGECLRFKFWLVSTIIALSQFEKARRVVRIFRPTKPTEPVFHSARTSLSRKIRTQDANLNLTLHAPPKQRTRVGRFWLRSHLLSARRPKTVVVVTVIGPVVVAVRRANIQRLIVEGPAAQQTLRQLTHFLKR